MRRFGFALITLLIVTSGCRDRNTNRVPDVPVNIAINIYQPDFFNLTVPSGWVYITGGSRGIIVYRKSTTEFVALERHSPFQPEDNCAVVVNEDNVLVSDPCSDSQWLITDGTIVQGPTAFTLRTYQATFSDPILYITN
jgi:hypothetical protein